MTNLEAVRAALRTALGEHTASTDIDACTYLGSEDPGGWAPDAEVVIHTEGNDLPNASTENWIWWPEVFEPILSKYGLWHEPVNGCVVAIYKL